MCRRRVSGCGVILFVLQSYGMQIMHFICFIPIRKTSAELTFAAAKLSTTHKDRTLQRPAQCIPVLPFFTIPRIFRKSNTLYFICKADLAIFILKFSGVIIVATAPIKSQLVTARFFLTFFVSNLILGCKTSYSLKQNGLSFSKTPKIGRKVEIMVRSSCILSRVDLHLRILKSQVKKCPIEGGSLKNYDPKI